MRLSQFPRESTLADHVPSLVRTGCASLPCKPGRIFCERKHVFPQTGREECIPMASDNLGEKMR